MTATLPEKTFGAISTEEDAPDFIDLNAKLNLYDEDGELQLDADKRAVREYFLQFVNPNTVFFHSLREKLDYLVAHRYYDPSLLDSYEFSDIKDLFSDAYDRRHRFPSFIGALKFYTQYALKTTDGTRFLERYEDRVCMTALYLGQGDITAARKVMEEIISGRFQPATPTFLNSGLHNRGGKVSCFLLHASDSMESITKTVSHSLQLSKNGGGVGINLTNLRESGAAIKGVAGAASGVIPVMKILEDCFSYANQLGARQGAGAVYLSCHHPDIMAALDTKRENADEKIRIKTLSIGVVITDVAFRLARENKDMYLFSPSDVMNVTGKEMTSQSITENYDKWVEDPRINKSKVGARQFFQTIAELQFESGYPYLLFEDTVNEHHHIDGRVSFSNLCVTGDTEILTDSGYRNVRDLYESQEDFDVLVDVRARDMDLSTPGLSRESSTKMMLTASDAEVFTVNTLEGYSLTATAWHKMYVDRDGELVKIPLSELIPGDRILVQSAEGAFGGVHEPDLAYLAGVIAAEGTISVKNEDSKETGGRTSTVRIPLHGDKDEFADAIEAAVARSLEGREDLLHRQATLTPTFSGSRDDLIVLHSAPLARLLAEHGVTKDTKVAIPEFVKRGDRQTQLAYLSGVWQLDGTITGSVRTKVISMELGSVHRDFLTEIQRLMLNLGVYSRIYLTRGPGEAVFPDGNGETKEYPQQALHSLRVGGADRDVFYPMVTWRRAHRDRWNELNTHKVRPSYMTHHHRATVSSVTFSGVEDVYDVTVENGHSVVFNAIATGNCSEITQVSTPSQFDEAGDYEIVGRDISCNLGSLNVANAVRTGDMSLTVDTAIRALTQVSDLSDVKIVPTVRNGNAKSHAIGLGAMNLHGFLGSERIHYGSEDALDFVNAFFGAMRFHALSTSADIAAERGEVFFEYEKSGYAPDDHGHIKALENYTSGVWPTTPQTERIKAMAEAYDLTFPTVSDWRNLETKIANNGLYHAYLLAVAPTGSISYCTNSTSSIHPVPSLIEIRKEGKMGRVYSASPGMTTETIPYFTDAYTLGPKAVIDTYAVSQKHVDQAQSLTLFFPDTATTRDLNKAYVYAFGRGKEVNEFGRPALYDPRTSWKTGFIKSLYYTRMRQQALVGSEVEDCVSCTI